MTEPKGKPQKESKKEPEKKSGIQALIKKIPYKSKKFWIIVGVIFVVLINSIIGIICSIPDYAKVDLTDKDIYTACKTVEKHGWKVNDLIESDEEGTEFTHVIDCSNTYAKVATYRYNDSKHIVEIEYSSQINVVGEQIGAALTLLKNSGYSADKLEVLRCNNDGCSSALNLESSGKTYENNEIIKRVEKSNKLMLMLEYKESEDEEEKEEDEEESSTSSTKSNTEKETKTDTQSTNNSSSEWKKFLKEYEEWVDDYIAFMKKYKNATPSELSGMLSDYSKLLSETSEWTTKLNNMQGTLSGSDLTEYINTLSNITKKLSEIQ